MEFDFNFKLIDGTSITVTAEFTSEDDMIGLTFPVGCRLESCLFEAHGRIDEIQQRAAEIYIERRRESRWGA